MKCRECGRPADPRYEMCFDDIGERPLQWCSECGPEVHKMNSALQHAFATRPGFAEQLEKELEKYRH